MFNPAAEHCEGAASTLQAKSLREETPCASGLAMFAL